MSGTTLRITRKIEIPGLDPITKVIDVSCQTVIIIDEDVADGVTDEALLMAVDVSELKAVWLVSDQDLTLQTNDGTTPDDEIELAAGVAIDWATGDPAAAKPLGTDVTSLLKTNASGSSARLQGFIGFGTP